MPSIHNTNNQHNLISFVELTILISWHQRPLLIRLDVCGGRLKCDGTRAEIRVRLSEKRTSPFSQFSRLLAAEVCASAVVMLDTPCSEVV